MCNEGCKYHKKHTLGVWAGLFLAPPTTRKLNIFVKQFQLIAEQIQNSFLHPKCKLILPLFI